MPHFVLEYSAPREGVAPQPDFETLLPRLGQVAAETGVMELTNIKLRVIPCETFYLCDGSQSFLHLTVSLLEGRTPQQKETLAIACRSLLVETCPDFDAISVDIRDMDATAYKKRVKPTG